jgi:hypothetical protein
MGTNLSPISWPLEGCAISHTVHMDFPSTQRARQPQGHTWILQVIGLRVQCLIHFMPRTMRHNGARTSYLDQPRDQTTR